jgi:hypothetical protein
MPNLSEHLTNDQLTGDQLDKYTFKTYLKIKYNTVAIQGRNVDGYKYF